MATKIEMVDNDEQPILIGSDVLAFYPEGDCDRGVVTALDPDRYFGTVWVKIEDKEREFLVEDVVVMVMEN